MDDRAWLGSDCDIAFIVPNCSALGNSIRPFGGQGRMTLLGDPERDGQESDKSVGENPAPENIVFLLQAASCADIIANVR